MAKISGALLSLGASGTIGDSITFAKWKGRPYARQKVIPANPNTTAQQTTRGLFRNSQLLYKQSPAIVREPWQRFVQGQALTEWNAFTGSYVKTLKVEADLAKMVFSPGAKGGLPPIVVQLTPAADQITVDFTVPEPPTGWTLTSAQAACVLSGDPKALTSYAWVAGEDLTTPYQVVLGGLPGSTVHSVGGWLKWEKPDGSTAYGASLTALTTTL